MRMQTRLKRKQEDKEKPTPNKGTKYSLAVDSKIIESDERILRSDFFELLPNDEKPENSAPNGICVGSQESVRAFQPSESDKENPGSKDITDGLVTTSRDAMLGLASFFTEMGIRNSEPQGRRRYRIDGGRTKLNSRPLKRKKFDINRITREIQEKSLKQLKSPLGKGDRVARTLTPKKILSARKQPHKLISPIGGDISTEDSMDSCKGASLTAEKGALLESKFKDQDASKLHIASPSKFEVGKQSPIGTANGTPVKLGTERGILGTPNSKVITEIPELRISRPDQVIANASLSVSSSAAGTPIKKMIEIDGSQTQAGITATPTSTKANAGEANGQSGAISSSSYLEKPVNNVYLNQNFYIFNKDDPSSKAAAAATAGANPLASSASSTSSNTLSAITANTANSVNPSTTSVPQIGNLNTSAAGSLNDSLSRMANMRTGGPNYRNVQLGTGGAPGLGGPSNSQGYLSRHQQAQFGGMNNPLGALAAVSGSMAGSGGGLPGIMSSMNAMNGLGGQGLPGIGFGQDPFLARQQHQQRQHQQQPSFGYGFPGSGNNAGMGGTQPGLNLNAFGGLGGGMNPLANRSADLNPYSNMRFMGYPNPNNPAGLGSMYHQNPNQASLLFGAANGGIPFGNQMMSSQLMASLNNPTKNLLNGMHHQATGNTLAGIGGMPGRGGVSLPGLSSGNLPSVLPSIGSGTSGKDTTIDYCGSKIKRGLIHAHVARKIQNDRKTGVIPTNPVTTTTIPTSSTMTAINPEVTPTTTSNITTAEAMVTSETTIEEKGQQQQQQQTQNEENFQAMQTQVEISRT